MKSAAFLLLVAVLAIPAVAQTERVHSPDCSDARSMIRVEESTERIYRIVRVTNTGNKTLMLWTLFQGGTRDYVISGLTNLFKPGETTKFSMVLRTGNRNETALIPAYQLLVMVEADHWRDPNSRWVGPNACGKSTIPIERQLQAKICDEMGAAQGCYTDGSGKDVRKY